MGNDGVKAQWGGSSYISIHVPSWGTTASGDPSTAPDRISIHVPSWGTTIHRHAEVDYVQFQSTFPRGERPGITMTFTRALPFQSTFPRGERRFLRGGSRLVSYFNPRSLVGNDEQRSKHLRACRNFNPRSLVGNDKTRPRDRLQLLNFNPRSLVGNDSLETCIYCPIADFNPRSLVGNDFLANSLSPVITISIHVPSWGTTMEEFECKVSPLISIHVPSWGTTGYKENGNGTHQFQSTFPRGERPTVSTGN